MKKGCAITITPGEGGREGRRGRRLPLWDWPIKSDCLNAIFISRAIEFLHNLAKLITPAPSPAPFDVAVTLCEYALPTEKPHGAFCPEMTGCT